MPKKTKLPVPLFGDEDLATRGQRRAALDAVVEGLCNIRDAEEAYMTRIPANLRDSPAFDSAAECLDALDGAIIELGDAFAL
jgi:hypothetical protein